MPATARHPGTAFDEALQAERRTAKWLAEQLGAHESQISRWRRGVNIPSHAYQRRIAKLLKTSAMTLWPPEKTA
jgi:transcriptional regulator with XRE-family HTH domain